MFKDINILILCGGEGLRLLPITKNIPKPLVKIKNKPLIKYIIDQVISLEFNKIILATGYQSIKIEKYIKSLKPKKYKNIEIMNSGKTDIIKRLCDYKKKYNQDVIVIYGDTLADINFNKLIKFNKVKNKSVSVSVYQNKSQFGLFQIDKNSNVIKYREKPILSDWINIGYFYFRSVIFNEFSRYKSFENFLISCQKKNELNAFKHKGNHITVNTISELINAKDKIKYFENE